MMSKNLMPEIAKLLGLEPDEEFKIQGNTEELFRITTDGLQKQCPYGWANDDNNLTQLLTGKQIIDRVPFRPKQGETYYYVNGIGGTTSSCRFDGAMFDMMAISFGNCFRTREAAEAAAKEEGK